MENRSAKLENGSHLRAATLQQIVDLKIRGDHSFASTRNKIAGKKMGLISTFGLRAEMQSP